MMNYFDFIAARIVSRTAIYTIAMLIAMGVLVPLDGASAQHSDTMGSPSMSGSSMPDLILEYLEEAAEQNPGIRARFTEYLSRLEQIPQVGALPDPEVMLGFHLSPPEADPLPGRFMGMVQQRFPWPGTLGAREDEQYYRAEAAYQRFEETRLELLRDITEAWSAYALVERRISIARENLDLIDQLMPISLTRYESGEGRQSDVLRLRMEQAELRTNIESLEDRRIAARASFNQLLGRDSDSSIRTTDELPEPDVPEVVRTQSTELLADSHPVLQNYEALQEAERAAERTATLASLPDIGVGVEVMGRNYGVMRMMEGGEAVFARLSIRIPLQQGRYRAQREEARLNRETASLNYEQQQNELVSELEHHRADLLTAERDVVLYRDELVPQADQTLTVLESDYMGGLASVDELITVQRQLLGYASDLAEARANRLNAIANLELHTATHLEEPSPLVDEEDRAN